MESSSKEGGGSSNGGMLYHEVQDSKLCAMHCVNTVLQGPYFSEFDLAALVSDLDNSEQQMMIGTVTGDQLPESSHTVSRYGDFSIQVLQKALDVWDLQIIPLDSPVTEAVQIDPEKENAFICHLLDHWFCIRKVNGEWYNFDSLYTAPKHLSQFYLSAYLDSLKGEGWSIFPVRGNFPNECPTASFEASSGYGQWLSPEDAERITKSSNSASLRTQKERGEMQLSDEETEMLFFGIEDDEDEDLKAAIVASLIMDSSRVPSIERKRRPEKEEAEMTLSDEETEMLFGIKDDEDEGLKAAIAASLMDSSRVTETRPSASGDAKKKSDPEKA